VTILHKIHYSIEVPKAKTDYWFSKYNRVLLHYSVSIAAASVFAAAAGIRIMCPSGATYLPADCCFTINKSSSAC